MQKWLIELLIRSFGFLSPELRSAVLSGLSEMEAKAKETKNPWDDVFVFLLKAIVGA